jgi:hypothetical protein
MRSIGSYLCFCQIVRHSSISGRSEKTIGTPTTTVVKIGEIGSMPEKYPRCQYLCRMHGRYDETSLFSIVAIAAIRILRILHHLMAGTCRFDQRFTWYMMRTTSHSDPCCRINLESGRRSAYMCCHSVAL